MFRGRMVTVLGCWLALAATAGAQEPDPVTEGSPKPSELTARAAVPNEPIPGEVIVRWHSETPAAIRSKIVKLFGGKTLGWNGAIHHSLIDVPSIRTGAASLEAVLKALKTLPEVYAAEPNLPMTPNGSFNDTWADNGEWMELPAAQELTRGNGVILALVEGGAPLRTHPDLERKLLPAWHVYLNDSAPHGAHATWVAGVAGAEGNNGKGIVGACPGCALLPVNVAKSVSSDGMSFSYDAFSFGKGIVYAADAGAKVINLSSSSMQSSSLESAVNYAWNKGAFLTCSAGDPFNGSTQPTFPAAYGNCFGVTGTWGPTRSLPAHANSGWWVAAGAPNEWMIANERGGWSGLRGSSLATAAVSGVAGLLSGLGQSNYDIRHRLCSTVDAASIDVSCRGQVNARKAVENLVAPAGTAPKDEIPNGGFENADGSPWKQTSSGGYGLIDQSAWVYRGKKALWLGGANNAWDVAEQTIAVTSSRPYLRFKYYVSSEEYGNTPYDTMRLRVLTPSGNQIWGAGALVDNGSTRNRWMDAVVPMHSAVGQIVRLQFEGRNDGSLPTHFRIDDIELIVAP